MLSDDAVNNPVTSGGEGQEHSLSDELAFIEEGSDEKEKEVPEKTEKETEEKVEDLEDNKEDKKEEELDEEQKDFIKTRPSFKEVTAKYPNLFKDFPDLRQMYFREQKYTELFPSVEDAEEAAETVEKFNSFDEMVSEGTIEKCSDFLSTIKDNDTDIYGKFVENFLPALAKTSPDDHFRVLMPVTKNLIEAVYSEGRRIGGDVGKNLMNSALHFSNYYFGETDLNKVKVPERSEKNPEREKLDQERAEFEKAQYDAALGSVESNIHGRLDSEIKKGLDNVSPGMAKILAKEIKSELDASVVKDATHMARMKSLWKKASQYGYTKEWTDKIVSAYLSRARQILPELRNKIVSEALSDKKRQADADLEKSDKPRRDISSEGRQRFGTTNDPKKVDWSKTSDRDLLDDRVTTRR